MKHTRVKLDRFLKVSERITGPRVLVTDIETFPILAFVWSLWKQNISIPQIVEDWALMSFAAKWLGHPEVFYRDNRNEAHPKDDLLTMGALHRILSVTDEVLAHNGQKFDLPKIKARMVLQDLPPLPPVGMIDTLLNNRKTFGFASQKLEYVAGATNPGEEKDDHNEFPGWKLWLECMKGNLRAWKSCEKYNIQDVLSLEAHYLKVRGWYEPGAFAINHGPYMIGLVEDGDKVCRTCGSTHVIHKGYRRTKVGIYPRYQCQADGCGAWSRGRYISAGKTERQHILA